MLARPSDFLASDELRTLSVKSNIMGAWLVLHAWGVIFGAMIMFVCWPNPFTYLLAVMIIGTRQLGLAVLMHDAAHGILFADRRLNDWVGNWLLAYPVGASLSVYRPRHLSHHRHTQQGADPDLSLSAPFPVSRKSLWRKFFRDLAGQTAYQLRREQFRRGVALRGGLIANVVLFALLAATGYWWLYPVLWLLPLVTWFQLVTRIRNIAEHAVVPDNDDPLRNTRTTLASPFERAFIAPYWVNYHLEHHLFMSVPCWRLPAAHNALVSGGHAENMEIRQGYRAVLALAAPSHS